MKIEKPHVRVVYRWPHQPECWRGLMVFVKYPESSIFATSILVDNEYDQVTPKCMEENIRDCLNAILRRQHAPT